MTQIRSFSVSCVDYVSAHEQVTLSILQRGLVCLFLLIGACQTGARGLHCLDGGGEGILADSLVNGLSLLSHSIWTFVCSGQTENSFPLVQGLVVFEFWSVEEDGRDMFFPSILGIPAVQAEKMWVSCFPMVKD